MNILILRTRNDFHNQKNLRSKIYNFLKLIEGKKFIFDYRNLHLTFFNLLFKNYKYSLYIIFKVILSLPIYLLSETRKIYSNHNQYYKGLRICIDDAIERTTGDIRPKEETNKLRRDYRFLYLLRSVKLVFVIQLFHVFRKVNKIDVIFSAQLDGYPMSAIWFYCLKNDIYGGSYAYNNKKLWIMIRKEKIFEGIALKEDIYNLSKMSDAYLNREIHKLKKNYQSTKKNNFLIKKYGQSNKKIGLVLLHVFTDQSRMRLGNSWLENYYDWLLDTLNLCKKNKEVKWIFKAHPHEDLYPIREDKNEKIVETIKKNGFEYIPSTKDITAEDIAEIASFIVTCTGTAKLEYPALFEIPVISCIAEYITFDSKNIFLSAKNYREYEYLILNAHNLKLNSNDIRQAKELLAFLQIFSGTKIDEEIKLKTYLDNQNNFLYRNF